MRRTFAFLAAAFLACFASLGTSGTARAECPYFVIPPAPEAARSAREVIVGTVIENVGGQFGDFRLRIDHVLRGPAKVGEVRRFEFLYPGWPFLHANGQPMLTDQGEPVVPCEPISAWEGNVIALSLDALAPDGKTRYNAASRLPADPPINQHLPRTTLAEMVRLAGLPQTDTAILPSPVGDQGASAVAVLSTAVITAFAAFAALCRRDGASGGRHARSSLTHGIRGHKLPQSSPISKRRGRHP